MSEPTFNKDDLVKRINYHNLFQEIVHVLPTLLIEHATTMSEEEVKLIRDFKGNVMLIAIAIAHSVKSLYKTIPEYTEMRHISQSAYSELLYNAVNGLTTIDERLLKSPLQRLFGDDIYKDGALNPNHNMFAYVKVFGAKFIAESKRTMPSHLEEAFNENFLSFQPYKKKEKASYKQKQLIFLPVIKPKSQTPKTKAKWQLYYLSSPFYGVALACTADTADDRFKVYYEDIGEFINSALEATKRAKQQLNEKCRRIDNAVEGPPVDETTCRRQLCTQFGFKAVELKKVDPRLAMSYESAFLHIKNKLGALADFVNKNTKICFTSIRKGSLYDRKAKMMVISIDKQFHDGTLGYLYGQALDYLIAASWFDKPNHLGSDYWSMLKPENDLSKSIIHLYKCLSYQHACQYVYAACLLDGLTNNHYYAHPAELFARAIMGVLGNNTAIAELQLPRNQVGKLLHPQVSEIDVFEMALDNLVASMPEKAQTTMDV